MKYTLVVFQAAAIDAGLLGKVGVEELCLLYYLRGWFFCGKAKIMVVGGQKFFWLRYETAIEELPLLFNPEAQIASRKNQLVALIQKLRKAELVQTKKFGRRLFFRLTDLGVRATCRHGCHPPVAMKPASSVTPPHDETITPGQDGTVMPLRDEYLPANIDETDIKEYERKETPPLSPCEGEAESILSFWNSFSQFPPAKTITANRARQIRKRLADPFWREHWRDGVERIAKSDFAKGGGQYGWRATLDWFLGGDSLVKVLEGQYDNRPQPGRNLAFSDIKAQLKAVEETIATHPANDHSANYEPEATQEQWEDLEKLRRRRTELLRQLIGESSTARKADDFEDWWKCPAEELRGYIYGAFLSGDQKIVIRLREIYETRRNEPKRW